MTIKETTRRSRSSCQLLTAGQSRDRHSRKLNIQKRKNLCTCGYFRKEIAVEYTMNDMGILLKSLHCVITDGAPAMLSEAPGFTGRMKIKVRDAGLPPISSVHCILHPEQLCAKTFRNFKSIMDVVITCVNFCREVSTTAV
ncbi:unnamed protein product [Acanthoscelides obtectus]|uniref:Transposase n=1 Tax=Acanthoscelides obtectus TaxID=200917 RepID=A0A9P0KC29_ACAOB|nr:unnamed protein product [Acanthoscelides obtectus]CAK1635044.1 hypothetical protein AOBTE_LOCUS9020 [Acanthoscelides obtectus]